MAFALFPQYQSHPSAPALFPARLELMVNRAIELAGGCCLGYRKNLDRDQDQLHKCNIATLASGENASPMSKAQSFVQAVAPITTGNRAGSIEQGAGGLGGSLRGH